MTAHPHDPVARAFRPKLRERQNFWVTIILAMMAVAILSVGLLNADSVSSESKHRTTQLRDALCGTPESPGLLPTIANAPLDTQTSQLGRRVIAGARRAAEVVHCPNVR